MTHFHPTTKDARKASLRGLSRSCRKKAGNRIYFLNRFRVALQKCIIAIMGATERATFGGKFLYNRGR